MDRLPTGREILLAALPKSYIEAKKALRACARQFTPERYAKAVVALYEAYNFDEVSTEPDQRKQLATYAKLCDDDELIRLSRLIERKREAWKAGVSGTSS